MTDKKPKARKSVSKLEDLFEAQLKMSGLPQMEREFPFNQWRFDFASSYYRIAIEVDGGTWSYGRHNRPKGYEKDIEKHNEAALEGWILIRGTGTHVKSGQLLIWARRAFETVGVSA